MSKASGLLAFSHRWIGISTCLLSVAWLLSGLVMIYVPFPAYTDAERLNALRAIDPTLVAISPQQALVAANVDRFPDLFRLEMLGAEPVYHVYSSGETSVVSGITGKPINAISGSQALTLMRASHPTHASKYLGEVVRDQWTVTRRFDVHRPLHLLTLGDTIGTHVYVSSRTGEIVQNSTHQERVWNWFGSIPHWIYFTPLRTNSALWRQVVMWTSGLVSVGVLVGLYLGILRMRRKAGQGVSPYKSWLKWHHITGLMGGILLAVWIVSGWLSVDPFGLFTSPEASQDARAGYSGKREAEYPLTLDSLQKALSQPEKGADFQWVGGQPTLILRDAGGKKLRDGRTGLPRGFGPSELSGSAQALVPTHRIGSSEILSEADAYWDNHQDNQPLPILRLRFDDPNATWVHIDPMTGEICDLSDKYSRLYRWVFEFAHTWNLPVLLRHEHAREIVMWTMILCGLAISLSGCVLAWRSLIRLGSGRGGDP